MTMMASEMDCAQVMDHLMFQRSLIDDEPRDDREARLESYVRTVEDI